MYCMNALFIDSGIGGITTLCEVIKHIPTLNFIYYADNRFAPYGDLNSATITNRMVQIINSQLHNNIGLIVIACNTATANSIDILRSMYNIPIIGTEPAIKPTSRLGNNVLVLATPSTTRHLRIKKLINDCSCPIKVVACKTLANNIDKAILYKNKLAINKINNIISDIKKLSKNKTHIVLGCTHYVYLKDKLSTICNCTVIDGNYGVLKQVMLHVNDSFCSKKPTGLFVLSQKNSVLCKKYRKIFKQTLANVVNVW